MPDSVIKKIEQSSAAGYLPGALDFGDQNGVLFEWNEDVDESPEHLLEVEDVIQYPSLAAEHPGVVLGRNQPLPSIEMDLIPQGRAENEAARNANLERRRCRSDSNGSGTTNAYIRGGARA